MSKYLGKLLLDNCIVERPNSVSVKYVASRDAFCFRIECVSGSYAMYIGSELAFAIARLIGTLDFQYQWSVGYSVRAKKGVESLREMRDKELELLGGKKKLVLTNQLDNDDDFDMLCAIQYKYQFSVQVLNEIKKQSKRRKWGRSDSVYVQLQERVQHKGRKLGSKNIAKGFDDSESLEDILSRCEHNKRAGIEKGFLSWYLDACKEECKVLGQKFDREKCIEQWAELRKDINEY